MAAVSLEVLLPTAVLVDSLVLQAVEQLLLAYSALPAAELAACSVPHLAAAQKEVCSEAVAEQHHQVVPAVSLVPPARAPVTRAACLEHPAVQEFEVRGK